MVRLKGTYETPEIPKAKLRRVLHFLKEKAGRHLTQNQLNMALEGMTEREGNPEFWRETNYSTSDAGVLIIKTWFGKKLGEKPVPLHIKTWLYDDSGKLVKIEDVDPLGWEPHRKMTFKPPGRWVGKEKVWSFRSKEPPDKPPRKWFKRRGS